MNDVSDPTSVRLEVEIAVPIADAFRIFTQHFDAIKPREHNMLSVEIAETIMEPWPGGRLIDVGIDGTTCQWGRVLSVEAPRRIVFAWDISPYWQIETDTTRSSEVEVSFTDLDAGTTRVVLVHRHLDRHAEGWQGLREAVAGDEGWPRYINAYTALINEDPHLGR
jgi:uncharacterized protein YndB with AHSA1/START domain